MRDHVTFFELGKTHDDVALDVIRIFLGVALFIRGLLFVSDSSAVMDIVAGGEMDYLLPSLMYYAAILAHLMGGLMLAAGLLTRIAALIQIPVLVGAVFIALLQGGLFLPNQSLELSSLVLVLLIIFLVFGSGKYSINYLIFSPGRARSALAQDQEQAGAYREMVSTWAVARRQTASEKAEAADSPTGVAAGESAQSFHDANMARLGTVVRYSVIFGAASVLLYIGLRSLPFEVSVGELGAVGGILILILSFFFLFFGWALRGDDAADDAAVDVSGGASGGAAVGVSGGVTGDAAVGVSGDTAGDAAGDTANEIAGA